MDKEEYYEFVTEYNFNNKKYSDTINASNEEEAKEKLKAKKETEVILGYDPTNPIKV
ncbi:hypothetical protein [Maribacter stanieri]|uniref:hypothetical protein n=1 Tax=Maribacter stanieri TaxID=440514 RepID=UPI0030DB9908